ncbi:MAG: hypothetical protein ABIV94_00110 [Acidimicrobiales bacterium]
MTAGRAVPVTPSIPAGTIGHKGAELVRWTGTGWAPLSPVELAGYEAAVEAELAELGALCTVSAGWTIGGPS